MGVLGKSIALKPFTPDDVLNRDLVIEMLTYEDSILHSNQGQCVYKNPVNNSLCSLEPQFVINRLTLSKFGFDTSDESIENFRSIFRNYYNSPTDYDEDVLSCSTYMRENRLMFYKTKEPEIGDTALNCPLLELSLDDSAETTLHNVLNKSPADFYLIHAFSTS